MVISCGMTVAHGWDRMGGIAWQKKRIICRETWPSCV